MLGLQEADLQLLQSSHSEVPALPALATLLFQKLAQSLLVPERDTGGNKLNSIARHQRYQHQRWSLYHVSLKR